MSPDGREIVYQANGRLYLRSMSELEARQITAPLTDTLTVSSPGSPVFSPDGKTIAYWGDGSLKKVAVRGGSRHDLSYCEPPGPHLLGI